MLVVATEDEAGLIKSFRNLDRVLVTLPSELEVAGVVWARSLLVTEAALAARAGEGAREPPSERGPARAGRVGEELRADRRPQVHVQGPQGRAQDAGPPGRRGALRRQGDRREHLKVKAKPKRRGAFAGTRPGWKKAIVQLREGDTIEIFEGAQV